MTALAQKSSSFVAVAGAAGAMGTLISLELRKLDAPVKALVRPGTSASRTRDLRDAGVEITEVDMSNVPALTDALKGAQTVVSALQGLRPVIVGVQSNLLEAAVAAKVDRFIPSDFSLDFTKTEPGTNRNLDLHREFHTKLDNSGIKWTSILNGGFMDMLVSGDLPMIPKPGSSRLFYFGNPDQKIDFTLMKDTAAFTAAVAVDPKPTPKFLRIAGESFSPRNLADIAGKVRGEKYSLFWFGGAGLLRFFAVVLKFIIGGEETKTFPVWQGLQYLDNMVSGHGKLDPLDNGRYPTVKFTSLQEALAEADEKNKKSK